MGAEQFRSDGEGRTVEEAFRNAKDQALYDHGHRGYSGSLADKPGFVEFDLPEGVSAEEAVMVISTNWQYDSRSRPDWLTDRMVDVYEDKWGEAVAIRTGPTSWVFVGWASS
jgi:hypothetical protein